MDLHVVSLDVPDGCYRLIEKMNFSRVVKYAQQLGYDVTDQSEKKEVYSLILYNVSSMFFVIPYRKTNKGVIQKRLEAIKLKEGEACSDDKRVMRVIDIGKFLGSGKYGAVYFATFKRTKGKEKPEFVLKLSGIPKTSYTDLKSGWDKSKPWNIPFKTKEVVMHYLINTLLTEDICPNFIYMYQWYLCGKCSHLQVKIKGSLVTLDPQECIMYILEKVDGDLSNMTLRDSKKWNTGKKEEVYRVAIFQTIMALAVLQKYYAIDHYDAGFRNIFYKKIHKFDNSVTYWTYIFNNETYHVPNPGYIFFLADYGLSQSLRMIGRTTTKPHNNMIGKVKKKSHYRIYDDETDEITYYPSDLDPSIDKYHVQDKGLAILTQELKIYLGGKGNEGIDHIQQYLDQVFIDKTGKTATYLINNLRKAREEQDSDLKAKLTKILGEELFIPPVDYSMILEDLFANWKVRPKNGICIGEYNADKPLPFDIDEKYLEILREKLY
jgi:hypothetical protein